MVSRNRHTDSSKALLFVLVFGFLYPLSVQAADPHFTVTFSKIDDVARVSLNDRVELQLKATTTLATTSSPNWPVPNEIPAVIRVLRLSYLSWTEPSAGHSDSILDACQQLALLAQTRPFDYDLSVKIVVPNAAQVSVYTADQMIAYLHTNGYQLSCNLRSLQ